MVFSSPIFLFLFLPVVLALYPVFPGVRWKNLWLLTVSILFYAWGEVTFVWLMLGSMLVNYGLGLWLEAQATPAARKRVVAIGIVFNLGVLGFFKYANFFTGSLNEVLACLKLGTIHLRAIRLPIGISFFTFHAISYLVDIYRCKSLAAKRLEDVALYIFFFPQLIAGPILRWSAMAPQMANRAVSRAGFAEGVRRFIYGLAKKMLLANTLAVPASQTFSMPVGGLPPSFAWFGAACYTLQIYFDFSGYSDMAIGMGRMFGFEFMENFNSPYVAQSVRDFWRRWHISLSTWFRDYVYFPLGGNRCSKWRNHFNLVTVFFLCGLWHGASWTFVIWGLYHGLFLALERTRFGKIVESLPRFLRWVYMILVVMVGWVFFRAESLSQALGFVSAMCGLTHATANDLMQRTLFTNPNELATALVAGVLFSLPLQRPWLETECSRVLSGRYLTLARIAGAVIEPVVLTALMVLSAAWMAGGTYNPFIYFRF